MKVDLAYDDFAEKAWEYGTLKGGGNSELEYAYTEAYYDLNC